MTMPERDLVVDALREPGSLARLTATQWDLLVRQARSSGLLPRLAWLIDANGLAQAVPAGPTAHMARCV